MHVLHVIEGREIDDRVHQALLLAEELLRRGCPQTVACEPGGVPAIAAQSRGLNVVMAPATNAFGMMRIIALRRLIKQVSPDLVHVHSRKGGRSAVGFAALLAGRQSIVSCFSVAASRIPFSGSSYWFQQRVLARSASLGAQMVAAGLPKKKLRIVRLAVRTSDCQPSWSVEKFRKEFDLDEQDFAIGILPDSYPLKDHRNLVNALARFHAAYLGARVILLGDGAIQHKIERLIRSVQLESMVRFAGRRTDLRDFLGCFDLILHPALQQEPSMLLIEAQASGTPVVAFDTQMARDMVARVESGNIVPVGDYQQLSSAVTRLMYGSTKRRAISLTARRWAGARFSAAAAVDETLETYREIIGAKHIESVAIDGKSL